MIKGVEFYILLWVVITFGIVIVSRNSHKVNISIIKAVLFGALTAFVSLGILILIVFLF
jgi:heme A synthase